MATRISDTHASASEQSPDLPRKLGALDLTALAAGNMIGAAIFLTPAVVARTLPSPLWILAAWAFAGLVSLAGALTCAEFGTRVPASGGQYVYLRESFGRFPAFLFGWTTFIAIRSGGLASLAVGFSLYLSELVSLPPGGAKGVSVALLVGLAWINHVGIRSGAWTQRIFTFLKLAGIGAIVVAAFTTAERSSLDWTAGVNDVSVSAFGAALIPCLWAYQGWFSVPMVAGEARDPRRTIPLSLGLSVALVLVVYLVANVAYMRVLSLPELASADRVASDVMQRTIGPAGAALVSVSILISIVGAMNAGVLAGPRVYFAQARDRLLPTGFARVHPRYETPAFAIWAQTLCTAVLALSGSYEMLITYAGFASWLFYGLTAVGLLVVRHRDGDEGGHYRVWGYPATPLLFAAVSFAFVANTLIARPEPSLWGIVLIGSGAPIYAWMQVQRMRERQV